MLMKFVKTLCLVALVAMSAAAVRAGSISDDPKITIQKPVGGVTGNAHPLICTNCFPPGGTINHPLIIPGFGSFDFMYEPPNPMTKLFNLYVEILNPPAGTYVCSSNIFAVCGVSSPGHPPSGLEFHFGGGGYLTSGEEIVATLSPGLTGTPEPSTMLLFLSLGPAIGFAKKRWNSRQSA
jgi:hypothetical protein